MSQESEEGLRPARLANEDELFWTDWARETYKQNIALCDDLLLRLMTLAASMTAGSLAFLDTRMMGHGHRVATVSFFLVSLLVALWASMPRHEFVDLRQPDQIRLYKEALLRRKRGWLTLVGGLLTAGFVAALGGIVRHWWEATP